MILFTPCNNGLPLQASNASVFPSCVVFAACCHDNQTLLPLSLQSAVNREKQQQYSPLFSLFRECAKTLI